MTRNEILTALNKADDDILAVVGVDGATRAQTSSSSAAVGMGIVAFALTYGLHANDFVATDTGLILAFFYNYAISRRFVFRPAARPPALVLQR